MSMSVINSAHKDRVIALVKDSVISDIKQAGELLLSFYKESLSRTYKVDGSFATQADLASEKYLIEKLTPLIPGAGFYAEETGIIAGGQYCWVIDPLDGTTNFAHSLPYFCIAVALCYEHEPIFSLIYQPILKELFYAEKGKGAFINDHRLMLFDVEKQFKTLIAMGCYDYKTGLFNKVIKQLSQSSFRHFGAAALDAAYCAAGKIDGCLYEGTQWWDVAAGKLLIEEAGGYTATLSGGVIRPQESSFVGGKKSVFKLLMDGVNSC